MTTKRKSRAVGISTAGDGTGQLTLDCLHFSTSVRGRQQQLESLDQAMAEANQAGDDSAWVEAFLAWLPLVCNGGNDGR